ncbi:hypothetical protein Tco_0672970 [Tanacetum coccineum]
MQLVLLREKGKLLLSPQQVVIGDPKDITGTKSPNTMVDQNYLQRALQNKGIVDSENKGYITVRVLVLEDEGEGSERPSEPQPTPSLPHPSDAYFEPQSDPSPRPSPTIPITDPIPKDSGGNLGSQSSSDKSLSGKIKSLKAQVKRLKKQARPFILHHKAWLRTIQRKKKHKEKVLKTSKRRSVFKQGRKTVKSSKGAPTVPTNTEWDDLDMDIDDTMDYTFAQDEGKTDKVDEKGESIAQQQSTHRQDECTDILKVSTDRTKLSTDKVEEGTAEPEPRESTSLAAQRTPTPTPTTFGDDEIIAQVLLNMSQAKAVLKEKEKGIEIRNAKNVERQRTTLTRSILTLKPLPKIDPNDKGKKRIKEDEEFDTESEEITEAKKKFDQIAHDEEVARKMQEEWEAKEERKRLTEKVATKITLFNEYDFIQARIEADKLLAERVQEAEREQFTMEERAKFLHDTIATQRRLLAQQRCEYIRNKPLTKNQFRNQMMTYLKHVGNKKHADLKTKSFDEIKALYEKVKRFDDSFITIGSTKDERKIKEMNEGASNPDKKKKIVKEDVSAKVPAKQDVAEQGTKKRKGGHMKMIARKRKRPQPDVDSDDEHRKCLKIVTFEGTIDSEIMETKLFISKLDKVSSPEGDYLVVYRVNGNFKAFNYLMEGDLKIMMESSIEVTDQGDFWNDQQDWEIVTWRLYKACRVCILEFKDGTVIHMLVERKYPLSKELLQRMLNFRLEVEEESTAALDLIRFIKQQLNEERIAKDVKETLRSDQDLSECLNTSSMKFKESTPKKHEVKQVQQSCLGEDCWELYIPDLVPNAKFVALQQEIDRLKKTLSNQVKEKESLSITLTVFKTQSKEKESKYMDKEIVLENQNKELENTLLPAQQAYWLKHLNYNPDTSVKLHTPVRIEAPNELPKSQEKDTIIRKLKDMIKSLNGRDSVENVKKDIDEIETINIELEQNTCSIQRTSATLIAQINAKSVENSYLNAQLQEKVFAIAAFKNELTKLKGKNVVDIAVSKPSATIAPGMFKLDIEPISHRLKNNRHAHEVYLEKTIENTAILCGLIEFARKHNPSDPLIESDCMFTKYVQELLVYVSKSCSSLTKPTEKLVVVTLINKDKKVRFAEFVTSSSNISKYTNSLRTKYSNKPLLNSTGVNTTTDASGSKPLGNT